MFKRQPPSHELAPRKNEIAESQRTSEEMPRSSRIEIFGTRLSGSFALASELKKYLAEHGIEDADPGATRYVHNIDHSFFGQNANPADDRAPEEPASLPAGVIVFPQMRMDMGTMNATINTPADYIRDLCEQHEVPIVFVERIENSQELVAASQQILKP